MMRYVLIGSGVAGTSAAEAIRGRDATGEIVMVSADPHGFYSRPGLAYHLSQEIPGTQIFPEHQRNWLMKNVRYFKGMVTGIKPGEHLIEFGTTNRLHYDRLLLATGSLAVPLTCPGAQLEGVIKLDDFQDALRIQKLAKKARAAVVVGGGITALELVEGLAASHVKVHYFLRGDRFWGSVLEEDESRLVEEKLKEEGVVIHYKTELKQVLGKRGKVAGVETQKGEVLRCQVVGYGTGIRPRIGLAQAAGIRTDKGILVNEFMQTSHEDIYAAGDVAEVYDPQSGTYILDSLWNPAREQGFTAGLNVAGDCKVYRKAIAYNVTRLAGITTTIIGMLGGGGRDEDLIEIARGDSETFKLHPDAIAMKSGSDVNRVRMMVGEKTLAGALIMGDQTLSRPLKELILHQVEICKVHDQILAGKAPLGDLVMEHWLAWKKGEGERVESAGL